MGAMKLPEEMIPFIDRFDIYMGIPFSPRTNCAIISFQDTLTINFASCIKETDVERYFFTKLVEDGVNVDIITLNRIRPIPEDAINEAMERKNILFFEEGSKYGGVAERFSSILMTKGYKGNVNITAVEEEFVPQSSVDSALAKYKLDTNGIVNTVKSFLKGNNE